MSIHLSMNLLRTMLAATSDVTLEPACDDAVKRVRRAGAPKELLEMYRIGDPSGTHVEMNGVRLLSLTAAIAENAASSMHAIRDTGCFVFARSTRYAYALDVAASDGMQPQVQRFAVADALPDAAATTVAPSLDAFVFAFATNAVDDA